MVLPGALIFIYGVTTNIAYCQSWLTCPDLLAAVGTPVWGTTDVLLGWIYWGGRDPVGSRPDYIPSKKTTDHFNPSSDALSGQAQTSLKRCGSARDLMG